MPHVWPTPVYAAFERPWIHAWQKRLVQSGEPADVNAATRLARLLPEMGVAVPPPAPCNRTGTRSHDWLLCATPLPPSPCLVFSIGIGGEWAFEEAAAARGCTVHAFDPTAALLPLHRRQWHALEKRAPGLVHFHYIGLGAASALNYSGTYANTRGKSKKALSEVAHLPQLLELYAPGRHVDILKIDCEGCEWDEIAHMATSAPHALCAVSQLYMEWHLARNMGFYAGTDTDADTDTLALRRLRTMQDHILGTHGFRPFQLVAVPGGFSDQGKVVGSLARHGIDPVACCYNVQLLRPRRVDACTSQSFSRSDGQR